MPELEPDLIEPIFEQFRALLPERKTTDHPLGCHRSRILERLVFEKLVQVLGLRLRLPQDRRRVLLGEHPASQAGRVDRARGDGSTQAHLPGGLRPPHRVGALGGGGGRLHHQGPLWRGEGRKEPGG